MNRHIMEAVKNYKAVIVYGTGVYGRRCYYDIQMYRGEILFAVSVIRNNDVYHGNLIHSIESLIHYSDSAVVIVAVSKKYQEEMYDNAVKLGFKNILAPDISLNDYDYMKNWQSLDLKKGDCGMV